MAFSIIFALVVGLADIHGFIVPNEIPTVLSLVYSNIPPLKIGQDTRFGVGFRLGPHADFQTLIELGPQNNTRPIGPDAPAPPAKRASTRTKNSPSNPSSPQLPIQEQKPIIHQLETTTERKKKLPPKKTRPFYMGQIEFKKIPGIDT